MNKEKNPYIFIDNPPEIMLSIHSNLDIENNLAFQTTAKV